MDKRSVGSFLTVILIGGLFLASVMCFGSATASAEINMPKPSVPDFTVAYIDLSYDEPPIYGIDQYTGETVIIQDSYFIDNKSLQFIIRNQQFTPYTDSNGNQINLYYNFRMKGVYATEWSYTPFAPTGYTTRRYGGLGSNSTESPAELIQSNSEYTVITIQIPGSYQVPVGGQLDVQAQALIGYMEPTDYMMAGHVYFFTGKSSDWSNSQRIIVADGSQSTVTLPPPATPSPSPIPVPGQSLFYVESNSTVTDLFFNSTSAKLSFTVTGDSGTEGYAKITISKSLVSSIQDIKVYLDGSQLNVAITGDADTWLLDFTYMHSTHNVLVSLAANAGDATFLGIETWIAGVSIVAVILGVTFGLLVFKRRRK